MPEPRATGTGAGAAPLPYGTVIICSRNRRALLRDCVQSILAGDDVPNELVIVDQSDEADAVLATLTTDRACRIRYQWMDTTGSSRALNAGMRAATHDVLVFTHDDVRVDRCWYRVIVEALVADPSDVVITGRVLPERQATNAGVVPSTKIDPEPRRYAGRIWDDVLYPMNMAMARATARRIGEFDERLGSGTSFPAEDNDYGYRALEIGCTIAYVPEAVVWHRAWRTDLLRLRWQYGRGQGAFFAKHLSWHDRYIAQRMFAEWRRYAGLSAHYAIRLDRRATRYATSAIGLIAGCAEWAWRYRRGTEEQ